MTKFKTTQYPSIVGSFLGWWHKPINSTLSIVILTVAILFVFLLGIWFADQYNKIWSQAEIKSEIILKEY